MNTLFRTKLAIASAAFASTLGYAQAPQAEAIQLSPFSVKGETGPFFEAPIVANNAIITASETAGINAINIEDTIKYLPNLNIRKRYIGDTNGVTSIRGQNTWMTGRSVVSADGILLSNFLQTRWSGSPRWAAVSPDEIQYAEIQYGPYSAFTSGNALGGSINLVTRMPEAKESRIRTSYFSQDFSLYGSDNNYGGYKLFASYGEKVGRLSLYAFYNHLANDSHPQSFAINVAPAAATGSEPPANGAFLDIEPRGREQIVYGSTGPDALVHDQFKFKARYELTEKIQAQFSVVYWKNNSEQTEKENYLTDVSGNPIWSGKYQFGGRVLTVNPGEFAVNRREREDILLGLTLGGQLGNGWNFDSTLSYFDVLKDEDRYSLRNPADPAYTDAGQITWFDNTNWLTFDFKTGTDRFLNDDSLSLYAGYQFNQYQLGLNQFASNDWKRGERTTLASSTGGASDMHALYLQASKQINESWKAILGARQEWWSASDGYIEQPAGFARHSNRDQAKVSPKLTVEFKPSQKWKATANLAQAYRFPLVPELFQGNASPDGRVDRSNPDLQPEDAIAAELTLTRYTERGQIRLTYFRDTVKDAIFNLLDTDRKYSLFLNIDEVKTDGLEFVYDQRSFLAEKLDLRFNASYTNSIIAKNAANRAYEGNDFPRIPRWRINMMATYRFDENWNATLGARHQSHSFNRLENDDFGGGYGSISKFIVFDAKVSRRVGDHANLSLGIDNLFDEEYYVAHPYPQRTYFAEANFSF